MAGGIRIKVRIEGLREILRAFDELPAVAQDELRDASNDIASDLAGRIRAAGTALGPQDALAAATVKAKRDRVPIITAGTSGPLKGRKLVYGSEFGANGRYGFYSARRFRDSVGRQFRPHQGAGSYWFFKTVEENQEEIERRYLFAANDIVRRWGEG